MASTIDRQLGQRTVAGPRRLRPTRVVALGAALVLTVSMTTACSSSNTANNSSPAPVTTAPVTTTAAEQAGQSSSTPKVSSTPDSVAAGGASSQSSAAAPSADTGAELAVTVDPALHDAVPAQYKDGIQVAVYNDWAPDEFLDSNGELTGWSVDLAKALSARLGIKFTYTGTTFEAILPAIQNKRFDAGFASFAPTAERLPVLDFIPEKVDGTGYAALTSSNINAKKPADLCGHSIAVLAGAYDFQLLTKFNTDECAAKKLEQIDIKQFPQEAAAELAMSSGRVQMIAAGAGKLAYLAKQKGNITLSDYVHFQKPDNFVSIGVRKGDPLGTSLKNAMQSLLDDGTYQKVMDKWGVGDQPDLLIKKAMLITEANPNPEG